MMITPKNRKAVLVIALALLAAGVLYAVDTREVAAPYQPDQDTGGSTHTSGGTTFKYPEELPYEYISAQDWPPSAQVLGGAFTCTEAGLPEGRAGETSQRTVDGNTYCVTEVVNGAAGSIYTQYAYAFPKDDKTVILTFTLRAVQCGNYDEPEKTRCEAERQAFDIDRIVDRIAQTLVLTEG